jgi:outer membrane protein assembly factor BamE (lipoprotein component of BamABCDE complex)
MELEFVPVEDFYFALTLAVRTLEEVEQPELVETMKAKLAEKFGQPSTVAAANQNNYNYVFRVRGVAEAPDLVVSVADWQHKLRLGSDYGWALDAERKPVKTEQNVDRAAFTQRLKNHLSTWLGVPITA